MLSDTIEIIQGDSKYFTVVKQDDEGVQVDFIPGDKVTFSVKKNLKSTEYLITKESTTINDGKIIIYLEPSDTNVPLGDNYYYDFQYEDFLGDIYTLAKGTAEVVWEVTN